MKKRKYLVVLLVMALTSIIITACSKDSNDEKENNIAGTKVEKESNTDHGRNEKENTTDHVKEDNSDDWEVKVDGEGIQICSSSSYAYKDAGKKSYEIDNVKQIKELFMDETMEEITIIPSKENKITAVFEYELGMPTKKALDQVKQYMELEHSIDGKICKIYRKDDVGGKSLCEILNDIPDRKMTDMHITVSIPEHIDTIDASVVSGSLSMKDLAAQFKLETVSGMISLQNVVLENTNTVSSTSGTIELSPCILNGDLDLTITSGNVVSYFSKMQKKNAKIEMNSTSGSITCTLPEKIEQPFHMNCKETSGDVEINTNQNTIEYIKNKEDHVEAKIAKESDIIIKATSGTIEVH